MVDYDKFPYGKDDHTAPGMEIDGIYYPNLELLIAMAKALIRKGIITKGDVKAELP